MTEWANTFFVVKVTRPWAEFARNPAIFGKWLQKESRHAEHDLPIALAGSCDFRDIYCLPVNLVTDGTEN
jgi:hypothetical protein